MGFKLPLMTRLHVSKPKLSNPAVSTRGIAMLIAGAFSLGLATTAMATFYESSTTLSLTLTDVYVYEGYPEYWSIDIYGGNDGDCTSNGDASCTVYFKPDPFPWGSLQDTFEFTTYTSGQATSDGSADSWASTYGVLVFTVDSEKFHFAEIEYELHKFVDASGPATTFAVNDSMSLCGHWGCANWNWISTDGTEGLIEYSATGSIVMIGAISGDYLDRTFIFSHITEGHTTYEAIPEPSTFLLLGSVLVGLVGVARRKARV